MTKLLIVDDNQQNLYMLQVLLSANGFEVELASNGAEALEQARCAPPDMIISDILMPVMDGFTLCRAWMEDEWLKTIPFVFYTATYTDPKDEDFALDLGAVRFIVKPLEPDKFLAVLRDIIAKHEVGKLVAPRQPIEDAGYYKEYNATLIRKLEDKLLQLEETNRALELDIAERRRIEEKYRVLFESFPLGITITDQSGKILETNRMAEQLLGISQTDHERRSIDGKEWSIVRPDGTPMPVEEYAGVRALQENRVVENVEMGILTSNQHVVWLNVTAAPIPLEGFGVAMTYSDVTARKNAEEALRILNNELELRVRQRTAEIEAINKELQEFAYIVSHDLKAPLRGIHRLAQWLKEDFIGVLSEQGQEQLDLLIGRVKRLEGLIDGILHYSKVAHGSEHKESIDLNTLVPQIIDILAAPEHISIRIAHTLPIIPGDPIRVMQVFQNLLSNAVKFMDKPIGRITIAAEKADDMWTFRVQDNGLGIEQRDHERIFQIFQTNTPRDKNESTGIGLAVVKKIVGLYGGRVWVKSTPGQGSQFCFTWPERLKD